MYRTGHWGAALLVWAPVGTALLLAGFEAAALVGGAGMLALARFPDYDQRVPLISHRGSTHTLGFALLVGTACGAGLFVLGQGVGFGRSLALGAFGFSVGTLSVLSHLLGDALTPAGVTPFWPLSDESYSLDIVRADNTVANYGLLAAGVFVTAAVVVALR